MQKVGILGGTFDPVHLGHLIMAENAREEMRLNRVVFIPSHVPPHKREISISASEHRYRMVELAIEGNPFFAPDAKARHYEVVLRRDPDVAHVIASMPSRYFPFDEIQLLEEMANNAFDYDQSENIEDWAYTFGLDPDNPGNQKFFEYIETLAFALQDVLNEEEYAEILAIAEKWERPFK